MFYSRMITKLKIPSSIKIFSNSYSVKLKQATTEVALKHFDQFYGQMFDNWTSIRVALLCPHSYCAVANVFADARSVELFQQLEVYNMKDAYYRNLNEADSGETETKEEEKIDKDEAARNLKDQWQAYYDAQKNDDIICNDNAVEEEFMPTTKLKNWNDEEEYVEFYDSSIKYEASLVKHGILQFPDHWKIYLSPRGKFKKFPPPKPDVTGILNYYLMDGASILPVLALDIQKGEEVGDLCASPGGKTLAILFGLQFGKLVCNDSSLSRVNKLKTVLNSYLPATEDWSKRILVSNMDVSSWGYFDAFDKILLDVPCTNDRLSVNKEENNIFSQKRFNERMRIPQIQTALLSSALKALKVGGSLVYSTCSLSPIQNDGVVHMALSQLSTESPMEFAIQDLDSTFQPVRKMFQFSNTCRYGQLVVPFLPLNYGPMYISKISRVK